MLVNWNFCSVLPELMQRKAVTLWHADYSRGWYAATTNTYRSILSNIPSGTGELYAKGKNADGLAA
ncbi:hypothetical protein STEG23_017772, partial [Scotinomys teguina]